MKNDELAELVVALWTLGKILGVLFILIYLAWTPSHALTSHEFATLALLGLCGASSCPERKK